MEAMNTVLEIIIPLLFTVSSGIFILAAFDECRRLKEWKRYDNESDE